MCSCIFRKFMKEEVIQVVTCVRRVRRYVYARGFMSLCSFRTCLHKNKTMQSCLLHKKLKTFYPVHTILSFLPVPTFSLPKSLHITISPMSLKVTNIYVKKENRGVKYYNLSNFENKCYCLIKLE